MQSTPLNQPSKVLHWLLLFYQISVQVHKVGFDRLGTDSEVVGLHGSVQGFVDSGGRGGC